MKQKHETKQTTDAKIQTKLNKMKQNKLKVQILTECVFNLESKDDPGDLFEDVLSTVCRIVPCHDFLIKTNEAWKMYLTKARQFASFQLHPEEDCTAERRDVLHNCPEMSSRTKKLTIVPSKCLKFKETCLISGEKSMPQA